MDPVQTRRTPVDLGVETASELAAWKEPGTTAAQRTARSIFYIRRLHLDAKLGMCDWEKATLQPLTVDVDYRLPTGLSCLSDRLEHTIDHRAVVERIRAFAVERHYDLIEAFAEGIAGLLQAQFGVNWIAVSVTKARPFPSTEVGITIERGSRNP